MQTWTQVNLHQGTMDEVITVAAAELVTEDESPNNSSFQKASFSNFGEDIDVAGPGVKILSLLARKGQVHLGELLKDSGRIITEDYYYLPGTSMAAPHVAGVAALVRSNHPDLHSDVIKKIITGTSIDIDDPEATWAGAGLVSAFEAARITKVPDFEISSPPTGTIVNQRDGSIDIIGSAQGEGFSSYQLWSKEFGASGSWQELLPTASTTPVTERDTCNTKPFNI